MIFEEKNFSAVVFLTDDFENWLTVQDWNVENIKSNIKTDFKN